MQSLSLEERIPSLRLDHEHVQPFLGTLLGASVSLGKRTGRWQRPTVSEHVLRASRFARHLQALTFLNPPYGPSVSQLVPFPVHTGEAECRAQSQ